MFVCFFAAASSMRRSKGSSTTEVVTQMQASQGHCSFCFDVLIAHLTKIEPPSPDFEDGFQPLFVTWNKSSNWGQSTQLRGCIGTLEPRKLHTAVKDYALTRCGQLP
jgi:AMMECR1 domain-containing protein